MFDFFTLAELALGPLTLARVPQLPAAPGGIVVRPDAPKLDLTVVIEAVSVGVLTAQRPQPERIVTDDSPVTGTVVRVEPGVSFASPEALDRIAAVLDAHPTEAVAVYPWQKTAKRYEALSTFFLLASTMTTGAFTILGSALRPARLPRGISATTAVATGSTGATGATGATRVYGGGHIVAERRFPNGVGELVSDWTNRIRSTRRAQPLALLATIAFFYGAAATAVRLFADPSWNHFAWYAAYVFVISVCLRQVGKFARLATALYPLTLLFFLVIALRASFSMRADRVRAARA